MNNSFIFIESNVPELIFQFQLPDITATFKWICDCFPHWKINLLFVKIQNHMVFDSLQDNPSGFYSIFLPLSQLLCIWCYWFWNIFFVWSSTPFSSNITSILFFQAYKFKFPSNSCSSLNPLKYIVPSMKKYSHHKLCYLKFL